MKYLSSILLLILYTSGFSQVSTSSDDVLKSLKMQNELIKNSLVKNLEFKNIGPSVMSGRVTDIEVNPNNPSEFYVAYASGGLWHTVNNGNTFSPIMDNSNTQNIGDFDETLFYWTSTKAGYQPYVISFNSNFGGETFLGSCFNSNAIILVRKI